MQQLLEVLGDDEADPGALLLEHDVGRHRGAVEDGAHVARPHPGVGEQRGGSGDEPDGLVLGRRGRLPEVDLAALLVEQQQVGERAADVDAEPRADSPRLVRDQGL